MLVQPVASRRASENQHEDDRCARRDDGSDELLLNAREVERGAVAELAARAVVGEAGLVAHHHDRDVGARASSIASANPSVEAPVTSQPSANETPSRTAREARRRPTGRDLHGGHLHGLHRQASRVGASAVEHLPERLDVSRIGVVAEEIARGVGVRADHCDRAELGSEREHAVVLQQHDALAGDRQGELAMRGRVGGVRPHGTVDVRARRTSRGRTSCAGPAARPRRASPRRRAPPREPGAAARRSSRWPAARDRGRRRAPSPPPSRPSAASRW